MKLIEMPFAQAMEGVVLLKKLVLKIKSLLSQSNVQDSVCLNPCPHFVPILPTFCITLTLVTREQYVVNQSLHHQIITITEHQLQKGKVDGRDCSINIY